MKRINFAMTFVLAANLVTVPMPAQAAYGCNFGQTSDEFVTDGDTTSCRKSTWHYEAYDDGFNTGFFVMIQADYDDTAWDLAEDDSYLTRWLTISCQKRKVSVSVDAQFPDNVGYFGNAKYKIDNKKPVSFRYQVSSPFDAIYPTNTKSLLSALVTAKTKISFETYTLMGSEIISFPIGNLNVYRKKFALNGCKF
jgi:hypothetical protein